MSDLSAVLKAVRESRIELDSDFCDLMNRSLDENRKRFQAEAKALEPSDELLNRRFTYE